jgi:[NiFe] hydrogenase assembly HybE family chaperone
MAGVPVLHPGLRVQALGFELHTNGADTPAPWASGVLVTPWFMNLLRLPLQRLDAVPALETGWLAPGQSAARRFGRQMLDFIGAFEGNGEAGELGAFEACSVFSPMAEFADHAAAVATGFEVLRQLRQAPASEPSAARRGFLLGRWAPGQGSAR